MIIKNDKGREFFIRVVLKGDRYGLKDCLVHTEDAPLIEFYDYISANDTKGPHDYRFGPRGQFVQRYYASDLSRTGYGLNLDGGVDVWSIDGASLKPVIELAKRLVAAK